jgi:hypothetical protein
LCLFYSLSGNDKVIGPTSTPASFSEPCVKTSWSIFGLRNRNNQAGSLRSPIRDIRVIRGSQVFRIFRVTSRPDFTEYRRTIRIAEADRDYRKRFVVHADENLTAFVQLEPAICAFGEFT